MAKVPNPDPASGDGFDRMLVRGPVSLVDPDWHPATPDEIRETIADWQDILRVTLEWQRDQDAEVVAELFARPAE